MTTAHKLTGRADIHMHTNASDGLPTAKEVLDNVAKRGHLDVMAITDHDVLDASLWAYEQRSKYTFDIIPGVEVTARGGHVLGLWVTKPIPIQLSIIETVDAIHEQGGVAILAHPGELLMNGAQVLRYLGTTDGRNYVATRLVADIAENYYQLLALDKRMDEAIEIIAKAQRADGYLHTPVLIAVRNGDATAQPDTLNAVA